MNVLALCAGYGGLELGLHLATGGASRCVCYVECEASSAAVLVTQMEAGHLAPAPIWSDLSTFDAVAWRGAVDCVTAGFPCQPSSVAGKGEGTADARWLWPMVSRVIQDSGAELVFLENVPGLRTKGLRDVLEDLAAMGFDAEWGCLSAAALGASQGRDRLWVLAYRNREQLREQSWWWGWTGRQEAPQPGWGGEVMADSHSEGQPQPEGTQPQQRRRAGNVGETVGDTDDIAGRPPGEEEAAGGRRRHETIAASLQAWPPGPDCASWPTDEPQPAIRREAYGDAMPLGLSLRMLGNGVVPVVAAAAFRALVRRALGEA